MPQARHYGKMPQYGKEMPQLGVGTGYLMWCLCLVGLCGMQRFYVGQPTMGLLYLATFGFCGIGQLLDLVLIPSLVDQRNTYLRGRYLQSQELSAYLQSQELSAGEPTSPMVRLLQAAKDHGGVLSAAQAALHTQFDAETIEELLFEAQRVGYATVFNDPETGAVRYRFDI